MKQKSNIYNPTEIESKWQKKWNETKIYSPNLDTAKKPFYNLMMFPYPSAEGMHVGNMYAFTGSDIYGRFQRMKGKDVFEPMGLDGFGIHSENYAIKVGRHPKEQAKISEENFYRQLRATGNGFDWSRKLETYDPNYYKWTQWIFIQLFKKGLAYRKKAPVNFCPSDKTVLADEQVVDGKCERCGSIVEKRDLEQWFFKITNYADRLLNNIAKLDWSEKVKIAQREWIGKKEGINITYKVDGIKEQIICFTTRPDTNFGATFIVLGPEHPFVAKLLKSKIKMQKAKINEIQIYVEATKQKSEQERIAEGRKKTGIFTGFYAINNLNGDKLPIWISDFVLGNVGTGAVVGVPGHDVRDFEFATTFDLPIVRVVVGKDGDKSSITSPEQVQEDEGTMINSDFLNGLDIKVATQKIMDFLEERDWGKRVTSYHLRDWLISRQRYWGPPIPLIDCKKCGWQPVPDDQLPVKLPEVEDWKPKGSGESPLAAIASFVNTTCPNCGGAAKRETDVSDTFLDSSWYFFRYLDTERNDIPFPIKENSKFEIRNSKQSQSQNVQNSRQIGNWKLADPSNLWRSVEIGNSSHRLSWLPVDMYIGGAEHSVLHLLYSRFLTMVFYDLNLCGFEEPFKTFRAHGLLIKEGAKMSKSKGNVVIPDAYIKKFGADTLRSYLMFAGPYSQGGDFHDTGIEGMHRFLKRVWRLVTTFTDKGHSVSNSAVMHRTIKKVSDDIENLRYNTAIAAIMEYYNSLSVQNRLSKQEIDVLLLLLAPFAPHMTEELWEHMGKKYSIHIHPWPTFEEKQLQSTQATVVVQVNGKMRDTVVVQSAKLKVQSEIEEKAKQSNRVQQYLKGKEIKKIIYIQGKILNFVTSKE